MGSHNGFEYRTITKECRKELRIEGSRFIASVYRVVRRTEAEQRVKKIRKEFHDATHNSFAYRVGMDRLLFRSYDDGEPPGTAGTPILSMIDKHDVTNVLVVVTRYFGGRKLGRGGLARAYATVADSALKESEIAAVSVTREFQLVFPYEFVAGVMQLLSTVGARVLDAEYSEDVKLKISVPGQKTEDLRRRVIQITRGNIELG